MSKQRDLITLGDIDELKLRIKNCDQTIGNWKWIVKEFATEKGLTDQEAIAVANFK